MKRRKINRKLRLGLLCILIVMIGVIAFLLHNTIKYPGIKEEKITLYNYSNLANVKYNVFLKPNGVYNGPSMEEGKVYMSAFVDYIQPSFNYQFKGDRPANIKGDYEIIARVEGYITEEKNDKTIWNKQFSIIPKTSFQANKNDFSIEKVIAIRLEDYNFFISQVKEATDVDLATRMAVTMNVNIEAITDKGTINDNISPSISLPLNVPYFEIAKNEVEEKPGAIEETKTVQLPINKRLVIGYSVILGILLISLIYIYFYTTVKSTDPYEKHLKKLFKKHGNRFVALDKEPDATYYNYNQVNSIDDLVKIADELEKPIMYKYSDDFREISKFYVCADSYLYVYDLTNSCNKLKGKEPKAWGSISLPKKDNSQTKDM